jgi:hypothetical protein
MDAMIALSVMIMIILTIAFVRFETILPEKRYEKLNYMAEDTMNLLEYLKVDEVKDTKTISKLIEDGNLTKRDLDKNVLDLIASFWYMGEYDTAWNISEDILKGLTDSVCLNLTIGTENIYSSCNTPTDKAAVSTRIESGYEPGQPSYGYVAGATLTDIRGKRDSSYAYFGGYVGEGNITRILELPPYEEILEAYMEMNVNSNFSLYINGNYSGSFVNGTAGGGNMTADKWFICNQSYHPEYCLNFTAGNNTLEFNFTANNSYIGGGYFRVTYNTNQLVLPKDPDKDWYWFPGIKGFINLYDSFFVPGQLNNITMYLHYFNNLSFGGYNIPVYVTMGGWDEEAYISSNIGEQKVTLYYNNILSNLGITSNEFENEVSNKTVPITFGTKSEYISGAGISDAVLITDVSGSMDTCDVNTNRCLHSDCKFLAGCQNRRLDVAKDVDIEFAGKILGELPGNRLGLVSYSSTPGIRDLHDLTEDNETLVNQINDYGPYGYTCISCGIDKAIDMLSLQYKIKTYIPVGSWWLYNNSYPNIDPPSIDGKNWNETVYDDSSWENNSAILGFEIPAYRYEPYVVSDITNNGGNYYFRRNFTVSNITELDYGLLYVLSDDRAEVYLNGQLIDNDLSEHNATYWNRVTNTIFFDDFESYPNTDCGQADGNKLNKAPGFWFIDDHDELINLTCIFTRAHSGNKVLEFVEMNANGAADFGYAEKTLDLSGYSNVKLSYWWKIGGSFEEGYVKDHGLVQVWDGSWHIVAVYDWNDDDNNYHYAEIDLSSYKMVSNFKIRFVSKSDSWNERFYVDDVKVWTPIKVGKSYFVEGENAIAVKLFNNDANSAKFDLKLEGKINETRKKAMLVMSDGEANTKIPGDDQYTGEDFAKNETVHKGCEARDKYGIVVYTVAFGQTSEIETLNRTACWNCTACPNTGINCNTNRQSTCLARGCVWNITLSRCEYPKGCWLSDCKPVYVTDNADTLSDIYKKIAKEIVELGYAAQKVNITGAVRLENILYPDSYIEYNFTPSFYINPDELGKVSITREGKRLRELTGGNFITDPTTGTKEGWYYIPEGVTVVDAKITSYSSEFWTDRLLINSSYKGNWETIYNLTNYKTDYRGLGDPYIIQIPVNYVRPGNNSLKIGVGYTVDNKIMNVGGSPDSRLIYTMRIGGRVGYNATFGTLDEAVEDAKRRLNDTIKIYDVYVNDQDIDVDYKSYAGIRSIWGPNLLKVIMWENTTI